MNVTLFNDLADAYEKTLKQNEDKKVVVIISAAKIYKFDGNEFHFNQVIYYLLKHN